MKKAKTQPAPVIVPVWVSRKIAEHGLEPVRSSLRAALKRRLEEELYANTKDMPISELGKLVEDLK